MSNTTAAEAAPQQRMVKPIDSWWTVLFVDPIATRVAPVLARRPSVTPARITAVAHILAIASALLFANGLILAGAILFEIRFVLDCVDGKVARITGSSSTFGRLFDAFGDRVLVTVNLAALGWSHAPLTGLVLAGAYPLSHHLLEVRDATLAEAGQTKRVDRTVRGGWGAAMARRRLYPMPTSIDAEHLALFVAPLVQSLGVDALTGTLWVVSAFFVWQCARYLVGLLRAAAAVDALESAGTEPSSS